MSSVYESRGLLTLGTPLPDDAGGWRPLAWDRPTRAAGSQLNMSTDIFTTISLDPREGPNRNCHPTDKNADRHRRSPWGTRRAVHSFNR
jgi:hypothetical protein